MSSAPFRRRLGLFERAPALRLLFLATLGSGLGTWLAFVALTVDVFDRTGSSTWVAALLIADFLPAIAIGLVLGSLVDRLSRRGLMIASDLARCAVFCALPFTGNATQIVALTAVAGFATGFFRPAVYAGLPNLVADEDLPGANSLLLTVENLTLTTGPVLGGLLVAGAGPHTAYWINAGTFLVSAALLARIPQRLLRAAAAPSEGHLRDIATGFRAVVSTPALLAVLVVWSVTMLASGAVNVAEVGLAKSSFGAGDFGFGLLVGAAGLGLALGSFLAGDAIGRRGVPRVYVASIGLMALGFGAAAASPNVWVAAVCVVLYGAGNGAAVVCNALLVQRGAPDRLRGRVFTVLMGAHYTAFGLGMVAAGPATDAAGARWVWAAAAAVAGASGLLGLFMPTGADVEAPAVDGLPVRVEAGERSL